MHIQLLHGSASEEDKPHSYFHEYRKSAPLFNLLLSSFQLCSCSCQICRTAVQFVAEPRTGSLQFVSLAVLASSLLEQVFHQ